MQADRFHNSAFLYCGEAKKLFVLLAMLQFAAPQWVFCLFTSSENGCFDFDAEVWSEVHG